VAVNALGATTVAKDKGTKPGKTGKTGK